MYCRLEGPWALYVGIIFLVDGSFALYGKGYYPYNGVVEYGDDHILRGMTELFFALLFLSHRFLCGEKDIL